ncbi:glycoside hydrolase family 5 protein [Atractiella rhizophila]|nr:glycoside hydrolase family 5 protein [Atractiella rhizophila]
MLRKVKEYGFRVYMDPHQDLFSRFSGGDGAPYWAVIACGLNPRNFMATNAAIVHCEWPPAGHQTPETSQDFPKMIWATNYDHFACQTLNTLFFAGRDFAPKCIIDGMNIQDWLQMHYFTACRQLMEAVRDAGDLLDSCVIGWDSWNEPNGGLAGREKLLELGEECVLRIGAMPTPFQGMRLGMGEAMKVEYYKFTSLGSKRDGDCTWDPKGKTVWLDPQSEPDGLSPWGWRRDPNWKLGMCIWAQHGQLLQPDYFKSPSRSKRQVHYDSDYLYPFWRQWALMIREIHREAIVFLATPVFHVPSPCDEQTKALFNGRACYSTHFYDGLTLISKHWSLRGKYLGIPFAIKIGEAAIRRCFRDQLGYLRQDTFDCMGDFPTMIGEIGIPFDLDDKQAYKDGNYSNQTRALDASLNACDGGNCLNYTVWTYAPNSSHEHGDLWNGEDFSLFSADDARMKARERSALTLGPPSKTFLSSSSQSLTSQNYTPYESTTQLSKVPFNGSRTHLTGPTLESLATMGTTESTLEMLQLNDGTRALSAFCRPYPMATVGKPVDINFDIKSSTFTLTIEVAFDDVASDGLATVVYVPHVHYAAHPRDIAPQIREDEGKEQARRETNLSVDSDSDEEDRWALDLDVSVSSGTWESDGQLLRWYYARPSPEQGPQRHTITVKRGSGSIPTWTTSYGQVYGGLGIDTSYYSMLHWRSCCPTLC